MLSPRTPVATVRKSRSSTDTQDGKKTLPELFDGRSQLLAYNIMYGPDYTVGACPGSTNLADGFPWDFGLALTEEQQQIPEVKQMVDNHTYTLSAPDPFVAPYFDLLLDRTPKEQPAEPRNFRKDEYPD
jgi:hypothetical protein